MEKLNKRQSIEKIESFFLKKHNKKQVHKIRRLAMSRQIKLKEKRKLFCKNCCSMNLKVLRIKNKIKTVKCEDCGNAMRWRVKED